MIIEKIELENFMCYSGKNTMEFTQGLNVIIGDNGYGKSKLYDAFYWVLYDQVFVSEKKEFQNTKFIKSKLISDKAKASVRDGKLSATVNITFRNIDSDKVFILERKYSVNVVDGKIIENNDSEFTVLQKELSYLNAKMVNDEDEKRKIVARILPPEIKDYLWFQGEQVESIIDFNKHDSLTKAINVLSSIKRYDFLIGIGISAAKTANTEYDRELRRLSQDVGKSEQLETEKSIIETRISGYQSEEREISNNLSRAEARCEELLNKISDAQKINELQQKKKGILNLLSEYNEQLKVEQVTFHRKLLRNRWVLKGTETLLEKYAERFSAYEQRKLNLIAQNEALLAVQNESARQLQTRLPFNVPEPNYIQWMLNEEKCLVCDREAKKDSEEWLKIKELIDRPVKQPLSKINSPLTLQNYNDDFKRLYSNGLSLYGRIDSIDDEIKEILETRNNISIKVRDANKNLESVECDIEKLLSDTSLTNEGATNILNEYSIQNKNSKDLKEELSRITQKIEHHKNNLIGINDELKSLVTGEISRWLVEKKDVLEDFLTITKTTRDRVFKNLISQLEKEANEHYGAMTIGNKSTRGHIKLRKLPNGNFMPEITDDQDMPLLGSNTSNLILVKLASIMAIISAKSSSRATELYTLITDAPTSVFGEDYTIGFCIRLSKVYRQSIIMSKEFYKNQQLRNELLTNPEIRIGKIYMITPTVLESDRGNRTNLATNIKSLN